MQLNGQFSHLLCWYIGPDRVKLTRVPSFDLKVIFKWGLIQSIYFNSSFENLLPFIVCSFSFMENYIRNNYGENVYFITAMATNCHFHNINYSEFIIDLIRRKKINEIYIVNET